jgi:hypothetical protein
MFWWIMVAKKCTIFLHPIQYGTAMIDKALVVYTVTIEDALVPSFFQTWTLEAACNQHNQVLFPRHDNNYC